MAERKSGILPRIEILILLVFFISFFGWVFNKCTRTKASLIQERTIQELQDSLAQLNEGQEEAVAAPVDTLPRKTTTPALDPTPEEQYPEVILFVVIDGLNMRTEPNLNGEVIDQLDLFDEVQFLHEVTDSTTQLKLSEDISADEPWVKIRSPKGREGWVYGAGVHYHRRKYPGL